MATLAEDIIDLQTAVTTALGKKLGKSADTVGSVKNLVHALGNVTGSTTIDLSLANDFSMTVTGNITFAFTNPPGANESQTAILRLTNAGAHTVVWPVGTVFEEGAAPIFTASGQDLVPIIWEPGTNTLGVSIVKHDWK